MREAGVFSVLVTTPYATQRSLYEHGAPCHPGNLKRKEIRTRYVPAKKARKTVRTREDGTTFTHSEGPRPAGEWVVEEETPEPRRKRANTHHSLFGRITQRQGQDIGFPRLRARVPAALDLTIASIDQAQGLEADIVITSTTRANNGGDMGFVNEPERWNVNISRPRSMLFIVGNASRLHYARDAEFPSMLQYLV